MLSDVHVMGDYWRADFDAPSALGELVAAAKDLGQAGALAALESGLAEYVAGLGLPAGSLVAAVPPGPDRSTHPVPALAACVARALGTFADPVVVRHHPTPRVRETPLESRRALVEAAGYEVIGDVAGRTVVLVDDVILTGTTLGFVAELLLAAGALEVTAVVVCRTRRAPNPSGTA